MAITLSTSNHAYPGTGTSVSVTAGDIVIASCSWNNTAGNASISDSQSNSYTNLANQSAASNFTRVMTWYAVAGSTGTLTVTVSGGFSDMGMSVDVFTGSRTNLSVTSSGHTGTANPDTITLTTYANGAVYTYYASESTPVSTPSGSNTTLIQFDSSHADARFYAQGLAGGSYTFGYVPGTVQSNQNSVGVQMGNPPFGGSKTQPGISRISQTRTLTQPATSRIAKTVTKTQSVTARITGLSKTQTAKAAIAITTFKTQSAVARVVQYEMQIKARIAGTIAQPHMTAQIPQGRGR